MDDTTNLPDDVVLQVEDLRMHLFTSSGVVKAVDGLSFHVRKGETLGIVGESGSGKTMTSLSLMRLFPQPAGRILSGKMILNGVDIAKLSEREMRHLRGSEISMILQDPQTSLNPVYTIGNQVVEALPEEREGRTVKQWAVDLLRRVRVSAPEQRVKDYPHQMSGGMKQRVVGAIAIAQKPQLIIADEPTTALDVTIQLQYLKLLRDLQKQTGMAIIFITHDFGVVARMCDRVAVMYAGRIIEQGPVRDIFNRPAHPYTQALLASVPDVEEDVERLYSIEGQPPLLTDLPLGCRFEPRCAFAKAKCREEYPPEIMIDALHSAACWRNDPLWPTI